MSQVHTTQVVFEDSGVYLMGRLKAPSAAIAVQGDISSIKLKVFAKDSPATLIVPEVTVVVADTIFNSLQTADARWTVDVTGYNFRYLALPAHLPVGGKTYRFEFRFTPASGEVFHAVFEVPTKGLYGS